MAGAALAVLFVVLLVAALILFAGGRRDARALLFGLWFLLAASAFADTLMGFMAGVAPPLDALIRVFQHLQLDAFLPAVLWAFVAAFPRLRSFRGRRPIRVMTRISLAVGVGLFVVNLAFLVAPDVRSWPGMGAIDRNRSDGLYHPLLMLLSVAALANSLWRARRAPPDERRRVGLLLFGIAVGLLPITLVVTAQGLIPAFYRWSIEAPSAWVLQLVVYPPLLAMPLVAAYAVYARGALDVRLVIRAALRYALARHTVAALAVVPFLTLGVLLYRNRESRLIDLVTGGVSGPLLGVAALGLVGLKVRLPLLDALDRRFYRERYDARRILGRLIQASRRAASLPELAHQLETEIDQALHLRSFGFLVLDPARRQFTGVTDTVRPLPLAAALVGVVERADGAVHVDLAGSTPEPAGLPSEDQAWLLDAAAALLVPVRSGEGGLLGLLTLGPRKGDLPFTAEDAALLTDIGQAVGVSLENQRLRSSSGYSEPSMPVAWTGDSSVEAGRECTTCGRVVWASDPACDRCGGTVGPGVLPRILSGKFRVEERIGRGGMGVVYRATDLALDRSVAIKALPRVATRHAARLRQEARAMAAVSHPNLAPIYGAESWNGQPLLVVEYMAGGTLADRLREGPLEPTEALDIAVAVARGVETLHSHGILHRDIKPSNVGLTADGRPKLLDFGLAHLGEAGRRPGAEDAATAVSYGVEFGEEPARGPVVGTTLYLSPEALSGARPDPRFDVWGLSVLLQEALTGRHPFWRGSMAGAMNRILSVDPWDIRDELPRCPPDVEALMRRCFDPELRRRPASATEFRSLLETAAAQAARAGRSSA